MHAKRGIYFKDIDNNVSNRIKKSQWSLVIGAGASSPVFPSWKNLIVRLYEDILAGDASNIEPLLLEFSYDSVMHSVKNLSGLDDGNFVLKISETLYSELKTSLPKKELENALQIFADPTPGGHQDDKWEFFYATMRDYFGNGTCWQLSDSLLHAYRKNKKPASIISFNAEPLLYTLLTAMVRQYYHRKGHHKKKILKHLDIVTRSISVKRNERIPFFHIHGFLPIPFTGKRTNNSLQSQDKLVFSEGDYLNLSNSVYSWQSSVFLHECYASTLIFAGLSFSDSNLRKWLSWTASNQAAEISRFDPNFHLRKANSSHYWIKKKPDNSEKEYLIENSVAHLGVRLVWIDDYSDTASALSKLLGL